MGHYLFDQILDEKKPTVIICALSPLLSMVGKRLEGPAFNEWMYRKVTKPLVELGTGTNGTGAFFRGAVTDLLAKQEHTQNPDAVITALENIFADRAAEHPEDHKSRQDADSFIVQVRASLVKATASE